MRHRCAWTTGLTMSLLVGCTSATNSAGENSDSGLVRDEDNSFRDAIPSRGTGGGARPEGDVTVSPDAAVSHEDGATPGSAGDAASGIARDGGAPSVPDAGPSIARDAAPTPGHDAGPSFARDATSSDADTKELNLPRIPWEGGPAYYAQFPKAKAAGWTDPAFFPIGVWLAKPSHAAALKRIGVNYYMGAEHDGSPISDMTSRGMFVLPQSDEWTPAEVGDDPLVVGWLVNDECDNGYGCPGNNSAEWLAYDKALITKLRALNDGRFLQANYDNGIMGTFWCTESEMRDFFRLVDVASVGKYEYTSPLAREATLDSPRWPKGANPGTSAAYGWVVDQMRYYQDSPGVHPNWSLPETAMPYLFDENNGIYPGATSISVEQLEGACWSSIIHEARGLGFFQHNNGPLCEGNGYSLVDCDQSRLDAVKAVFDEIHALAPIINTQSYQYDFANGTDTMLKTHDGAAYVFAGIGLNQSPGDKSFTLPPGVSGARAIVVGENRTIPVENRTFVDHFAAEYSHHIYEIALDGSGP